MATTDDPAPLGEDATPALRDLALRSGDLHGEIMRSLAPLAGLPVEHLLERGENDLGELHARGRLSDSEVEQLREVLHAVSTDSAPRTKLGQVEGILERITASEANPAALTIATIAVDSSRSLVERAERSGTDRPHPIVVVAADVVGGIGGVFIGDELCGPMCAVVGGVAGAAGLSMLAADHL